jgi:hypothetical protein
MASVSVPAERPGGLLPPTHDGFWSWFTTVDHRRSGSSTASAFGFFLIGGSGALRSACSSRGRPDLPRTAVYNELFDAAHASAVVFSW